jgi:hypothetical protein
MIASHHTTPARQLHRDDGSILGVSRRLHLFQLPTFLLGGGSGGSQADPLYSLAFAGHESFHRSFSGRAGYVSFWFSNATPVLVSIIV